MAFFHPKVLKDLEFHQVLEEISKLAHTSQVRQKILSLKPEVIPQKVRDSHLMTDEYLKALQSNTPLPDHRFIPFGDELKKIQTENYYPDPPVFLNMASGMELVLEWQKFFKTFGEKFPYIRDHFQKVNPNKEIVRTIRNKIGRDGQVKDSASENLKNIRIAIKSVKRKRAEIFNRLVKKYEKAGYLNEIRESVIDERPVLAVQAAYRRKIPGDFLGTSRNGGIVFIEPDEITDLTGEIQQLLIDEQTEIIKILQELTEYIRDFVPDLLQAEKFLFLMDKIQAQARYAQKTNSVLPQISTDQTLNLKKAYHPILYLENQRKNLKTVPQNILLNPAKRIMVISGPNAGGKSITLKMVGLLQLMFQSGLPVPVDPKSQMPFFEKILTDIGDNQSIENQLSTYSYRLRNMHLFLRLADEKTLFLIDEFGTGSDPELGGALAEVFLEIFNRKKAFGVITTHYNNLKLLAEKLDGTFNAHMTFDLKNLTPTYQLHTGEPGSSYTFEVAKKIGIPQHIIGKAKNKVDKKKVRFDRTLSQMQAKQKKLQEEIEKWSQEREVLNKQLNALKEKEFQLLKKLNAFRELYEVEKRKTEAGEKILALFKRFQSEHDQKKIWKEIKKWMEKEGFKLQTTVNKDKRHLKKSKKVVLKEIAKEDIKKKLEEMHIKRMEYKPQVGDKVRIAGSKATAYLMEIRQTKAVLDYGKFTAEVPLKDLELVMRRN